MHLHPSEMVLPYRQTQVGLGRLDEVRISSAAREPEELSPNLISVICKI